MKTQWVDYMELTHRFIRLNLIHTGESEDFHYIDIGRHLSAMNRRLYRQGMQYHVANVQVHDSQGSTYLKFCTLPNTWTTKAAWRKAFKVWKQQRAVAQSGGSNFSGKWSDFKVYFNNDMRTDPDIVDHIDNEDGQLAYGEWDYSKMFIGDDDGADVDSFDLHMMGANNGSLPTGQCVSAGILANFEDSLVPVPDDPIAPDNLSVNLFTMMAQGGTASEIVADVVEHGEDDNDSPPYSATLVPGAKANCASGWVTREMQLMSSEKSRVMGGFPVPLGLIQLETKYDTGSSSGTNTIGVVIEIVPGPYKGVHAEGWA